MNPYEWGPAEWIAALCLFVVVVGLIAHAILPNEAPSPLVGGLEAPTRPSNGLSCHVVWCGKAHTRSVRGWLLCDEHYEEKVSAR